MKLLMTAAQVTEDRAAWLKTRNGDEESGPRIGASDIGAIMRLPGAYGSPYKLWMQKTGQWDDDNEPPDRLEFGNYCENFAAWLLQRDQPGWHVTEGGLYADDGLPWRTATFDRLMHQSAACQYHDLDGQHSCLITPAATMQLKSSAFNDWAETGIPAGYRAQCIWEAAIAGTPDAYLVAFDRNAVRIEIFQIPMDTAALDALDLMTRAAQAFRDLVIRRVPPDTDALEATTEALKRRFCGIDPEQTAVLPRREAGRWFAAVAAEKAAKERRRRHLNALLARAGTAGTWKVRQPDGTLAKIATRSAGPRAGFWTDPNPRVDTVRPFRTWKAGQ